MGNLLSRACAKSLNPQQIFPQVDLEQLNELIKLDACQILFEKMTELHEKCHEHFIERNFHLVVDTTMSTLRAANAFFEASKPWELKNNSDENIKKRLESIISIVFECLRISGIIFQPIIPQYSKRLLDRLNVPSKLRYWKDAKMSLKKVSTNLVNLESNILFQKIILNEPKKEVKKPEKKIKRAK